MNETATIARAAARLAENGIPEPQREARILWRAAKTSGIEDSYNRLIERRCVREPMSHLLGYRDFYEHRFEISGYALDPRPETETLVEAALAKPFSRLLDLGTGSGCILLSLLAARPGATGVGTDISDAALNVARRNMIKLGLEAQAELGLSDWFECVNGPFDLIVSNPPYIAAVEMSGLAPELSFEPRMALTDEEDGLSAYRKITASASGYLERGGRLMVEIGWTQGKPVTEMFRENGFESVEILPDLAGRDRIVQGVWRS